MIQSIKITYVDHDGDMTGSIERKFALQPGLQRKIEKLADQLEKDLDQAHEEYNAEIE